MTTEQSPARKALDYAEGVLGVNSVYNECLARRGALDSVMLELEAKKNERRERESFLRDREMELIEVERAANPTESQAAFERRFKVVLSNDGDVRECRDQLSYLAGEIGELEYKESILSKDIQIFVARMHELGGYFSYLAEVKRSQRITENPNQDDRNPWK